MIELKLRLKIFGWGIIAMFLSLIVIAGFLSFIGAMIFGPSPLGMVLAAFGFAVVFLVVDPMFASMQKTLDYGEKYLALRYK